MEGGGWPYRNTVISAWAVTHFQGLWSPCRDRHSIWLFWYLFHDAWLLITPGRDRITEYMVLTWLPTLARHRTDGRHWLTSNCLCVVWLRQMSDANQISSLESFNQATEYCQSLMDIGVGRSYRIRGCGSSHWGHKYVAERAADWSPVVFLKGLKREEDGRDADWWKTGWPCHHPWERKTETEKEKVSGLFSNFYFQFPWAWLSLFFLSLNISLSLSLSLSYIWIYIHTYIHILIYIHTHMYPHIHTHIHTHIYV